MASIKEFVFQADPVQHRARRVPAALWELHKSDIVREYYINGLTHTMQWMARTRNFHATYVFLYWLLRQKLIIEQGLSNMSTVSTVNGTYLGSIEKFQPAQMNQTWIK